MAGNRYSGRKPKPTKLKALEGNPGKRPLNHDEPIAGGKPIRPRGLAGEALKHWKQVVPELVALGIAKEADTSALHAMCNSWALYVASYKQASADPIDKAARAAVNSYLAQWHRLAAAFGLDPSSRSRLRVNGTKEHDPLAEFGIVA